MSQPLISIVSPVYRAETLIDQLVDRIIVEVKKITSDFEIILVEDGSPDKSWDSIVRNTKKDQRIRGIKLSRNFGQHYAITAGLDKAKGEWVVVMDCDLQDQPEEIYKLYNKALEGFDTVLASRASRKDSFMKKLSSKIFYSTLGYLTGSEQDPTVANFGIYNRKVIETICSLRESIRYFPTMVKWVGFKITTIEVEHAPREEGETTYNFKRLINLALDIILAYSDKPIRLVIKFGLLVALMSIIMIAFNLYLYFAGEIEVLGYPTLIISIWFLSGSIITTLGVVGLYIGKIFQGVKNRPIYIIDENI